MFSRGARFHNHSKTQVKYLSFQCNIFIAAIPEYIEQKRKHQIPITPLLIRIVKDRFQLVRNFDSLFIDLIVCTQTTS